MAIKDILVHLTDGGDCAARVDTAIALAQAHGAHLTGLYILWIPVMPGYVEAQIGAEVLNRQRELYLERANAARDKFSNSAETAGISFESRCAEGLGNELLCLHARYCDLLLMGRHANAFMDDATNLAESVILESGKPVMVLPEAGVAGLPGRHVAVAWNGSREAIRAIDAALPLLCAAERVDVLEVDPADNDGNSLPGADISTHLARHGVKVRAAGLASGGEGVGEALLARAVSDGADLLVMGAYGHARWRELILGGATAHVLRHSNMAVLMAH